MYRAMNASTSTAHNINSHFNNFMVLVYHFNSQPTAEPRCDGGTQHA
jgi:hypothetical protein